VQTPEELEHHIRGSQGLSAPTAPVWVVYPKGRGKQIDEAQVRKTMRAVGMVDTKVASVSDDLTALHFSQRKAEAPHENLRRR